LNSVIWLRIHKTAFVRNNTVNLGLYDAVLCFNDGVGKKNGVLNIIGESGSKSVNAMKRIHAEETRKTEILTVSITREARKTTREVQRRLRGSR
jgi:hypothetical protein